MAFAKCECDIEPGPMDPMLGVKSNNVCLGSKPWTILDAETPWAIQPRRLARWCAVGLVLSVVLIAISAVAIGQRVPRQKMAVASLQAKEEVSETMYDTNSYLLQNPTYDESDPQWLESDPSWPTVTPTSHHDLGTKVYTDLIPSLAPTKKNIPMITTNTVTATTMITTTAEIAPSVESMTNDDQFGTNFSRSPGTLWEGTANHVHYIGTILSRGNKEALTGPSDRNGNPKSVLSATTKSTTARGLTVTHYPEMNLTTATLQQNTKTTKTPMELITGTTATSVTKTSKEAKTRTIIGTTVVTMPKTTIMITSAMSTKLAITATTTMMTATTQKHSQH